MTYYAKVTSGTLKPTKKKTECKVAIGFRFMAAIILVCGIVFSGIVNKQFQIYLISFSIVSTIIIYGIAEILNYLDLLNNQEYKTEDTEIEIKVY